MFGVAAPAARRSRASRRGRQRSVRQIIATTPDRIAAMNRRKFIGASAALTAMWRTPSLFAQSEGGKLPPSIAALTSMRDQAKPITNDERRARIEKARRLMAEHKIGALILTGGTSLVYFAGMRWGGGERLFACVIPVKSEPFFVCPAFE
jgi:Xaa-Pro dipeptidase